MGKAEQPEEIYKDRENVQILPQDFLDFKGTVLTID